MRTDEERGTEGQSRGGEQRRSRTDEESRGGEQNRGEQRKGSEEETRTHRLEF